MSTPEIRELESKLRAARKAEHKRKYGPKRVGRGSRDRDKALKAARGYSDRSTFVRHDGSEVLKGEDWRKRKQELRERSGGRCEHLCDEGYRHLINMQDINYDPLGQIRCAKAATIPAHIIPRHPKRDDRLSNLKHYCFEHDRLTEKQSWRRTRFGEKRAERVAQGE